jgi:radical SAM protein with 4Fe4S-binding SPASM domain
MTSKIYSLLEKEEKKYFHGLSLELTSSCQLRCRMCYLDQNELERGLNIPFEKLKEFLIKFKHDGGYFLFFSGGEPLLYPHFSDLFNFCVALGYEMEIVTNGLMLDKFLNTCRHPFLMTIKVSILGKGQTHDRIVGLKGAFNRVIKNILKLDGKTRKKIVINFTILKSNYRELNEIEDYFRNDLGVGKFIARPLVVNEHNLERVQKEIIGVKEIIECDLGQKHYGSFNQDRSTKCNLSIQKLVINWFGEVLPCISYRRTMYNLNDSQPGDDVYRAIASARFWNEFKSKKNELKKCKSCRYLAFCVPCVGLNYSVNGKETEPSKYSCLLAENCYRANEKAAIEN